MINAIFVLFGLKQTYEFINVSFFIVQLLFSSKI